MTKQQHPLTDEICEDLIFRRNLYDNNLQGFMRNAADWQLDQVIEWLHDNLGDILFESPIISRYHLARDIVRKLDQQMRPQEDNS